MKMPLATFEGAIRVGQEKAAIAEEITLTYAFADAVIAPLSTEATSAAPKPAQVGSSEAANSPFRAAVGS
jgi:3-hydroxyacyl-[acyl-carrier-protein] dehydratase